MNSPALSITARALESAGVEHGQAQAIAEAIHQRGEDYATKVDFAALKGEIWKAAFTAAALVLGGVGVMLAIFT